MALDPSARYPGQLETGDPGYPYGKAQNIAVEGDGTGTPFERDLVNDLLGFQQALLNAAGITPSGTPDKVGQSQYLQALTEVADPFNIRNYGADPLGVASSQAALDAAIGDASAAGGGEVHVPAGTFIYTGLALPQGVSLRGVPGASFLSLNHASANALVCTQPSDGAPSVVSDVRFIGNVPNTGTNVVNNADARVIFERCSWNGFDAAGAPSDNLQGKLARVGTADSALEFLRCRLKVVGTLNGLEAVAGSIRVVGGYLSMPATYAAALAYADTDSEVDLDRVDVDCTAHTTGTAQVTYAASSSARAAMRHCVVDATGATGTIYGFLWLPDTLIQSEGNAWIGAVTRYGNSRPAAGSLIDGELPSYSVTQGPTVTIPGGLSTFVYVGSGTVPTFTQTAGAQKYQRLRLIVYNASGGNWTSFGIGVAIAPVPALVAGAVACCELQYVDMFVTGTFQWVMLTASP